MVQYRRVLLNLAMQCPKTVYLQYPPQLYSRFLVFVTLTKLHWVLQFQILPHPRLQPDRPLARLRYCLRLRSHLCEIYQVPSGD